MGWEGSGEGWRVQVRTNFTIIPISHIQRGESRFRVQCWHVHGLSPELMPTQSPARAGPGRAMGSQTPSIWPGLAAVGAAGGRKRATRPGAALRGLKAALSPPQGICKRKRLLWAPPPVSYVMRAAGGRKETQDPRLGFLVLSLLKQQQLSRQLDPNLSLRTCLWGPPSLCFLSKR